MLGGATYYSEGFNIAHFPSNGEMGMAFESISVFGSSPLVQTLFSERVIKTSTFGLKLASFGSELFIGGKNDDLYQGSITWVPLSQEVC